MGIYLGHEINNETAFVQCQDMVVKGLSIEQTGGDGIIVDQCERVLIQDVNSDGNNRQGLSIIGAKDMLVERCNFSNTNGTAPSAGIDIEPDGVHYDIINVTIRDCMAINNRYRCTQSIDHHSHSIPRYVFTACSFTIAVAVSRAADTAFSRG